MASINDFILNDPDYISPNGEEVWEGYGSNLALVRLKPGTSNQKHYQMYFREHYGILRGHPTIIIDGTEIQLHPYMCVHIKPGQVNQIFNHTQEIVLFGVLTGRPELEAHKQVL